MNSNYQPQPPKAWKYELANGFVILAGKTDADNDQLSIKVARPEDYWFHVSGQPGSHVILQSPDQSEPDRDTLRIAASAAAYHSKARNGGTVKVSCTQAKNVSKPRGAKPGSVMIRNEKQIKVKPSIPN